MVCRQPRVAPWCFSKILVNKRGQTPAISLPTIPASSGWNYKYVLSPMDEPCGVDGCGGDVCVCVCFGIQFFLTPWQLCDNVCQAFDGGV